MTALLASVRSLAEAEQARAGGVDIIDLKDPHRGALAALPLATIAAVVSATNGARPVSATAGDLVMAPDVVVNAVAGIAAQSVDFVKIGLYREGAPRACIEALRPLAQCGTSLVAVLFADRDPDLTLIPDLAAAGFVGCMLDTAGKGGGGLLTHQPVAALREFLAAVRDAGMMTGLAGALRLDDLPPLLDLGPDYLGFRGALTSGGRGDALCPDALAAVRQAIPAAPSHWSRASRATATAGAQQAVASRSASGA